jgi:hypothetical protein
LLVSTNEQLIAYEAATGKELWRTPGTPSGHGIDGTPIATRIQGRRAVQTAKGLFGLDGETLGEGGYAAWGAYVPVVEDGVLYNPCSGRRAWWFEAIAIAGKAGAKASTLWRLDADTLYGPLVGSTSFFYIASPLHVDGLLYQIEMSGLLLVIDTRKRELACRRWMDGYNYNDRNLYGYCASPTLAERRIYLMDGAGCVTILDPGAAGAVVGRNMLQNLTNLPASAPGRQEVFYASMYFDGRRMFVHGDEYLYCIADGVDAAPSPK